jgi:histidinol-phosphate aminotransferase
MNDLDTTRRGAALRPAARAKGLRAYRPPRRDAAIDLILDSNEGPSPDDATMSALRAVTAEDLQRYPDAGSLERLLADIHGLDAGRVLVTGGADEAIDRCCRAMLEPGRELLVAVPTFEMIDRSARLAGAEVRTVPWRSGPLPVEAMGRSVTPRTAVIAVVSPNNPTGAVATASDLQRLSAAAPEALLMVDLAYDAFATTPLAPTALALPNAVVLRTFSKAHGLAGLRVGWAAGPPDVIEWMRAVGGPYPVSGPALAVVAERLRRDHGPDRAVVAAVQRERRELVAWLERLGARPLPSEGNFVLARFDDAGAVHEGLARQRVAVRIFRGHPLLADALRITCPGDVEAFERLVAALQAVLGRPTTERSAP